MGGAVLKSVPEIIKAASATGLGILALLILVLALFGFYFFQNSAVLYRFLVFLLMFAGSVVFAYSALTVQQEDARRAQAETLPELKLTLAFPEKDPAPNLNHAHVLTYVQSKMDSDSTMIDSKQYLRNDVRTVAGPGGIYLVFPKLAVGDVVYVEAEDQGKKWHSYSMRMLAARGMASTAATNLQLTSGRLPHYAVP
jgi:hypothetical protein